MEIYDRINDMDESTLLWAYASLVLGVFLIVFLTMFVLDEAAG